tara:strand:- start:1385 stop:1720 length:336 start_codon:yes stop_codon:yes gene_type:complete
MNIEQKDIVLMPFPFTDLSEEKVRPVLIISNNDYSKLFSDIVVIPITSKIKDKDYSFTINNEDLEDGMLITQSSIKTNVIITLDKKKVIKRIAKLSIKKFQNVRNKVISIF